MPNRHLHLSGALSREHTLPRPPSGSTTESSLEEIPSLHTVSQQHQYDRSRSTSQPTPPSDSRSTNVIANVNANGQSPVAHPSLQPDNLIPDPVMHQRFQSRVKDVPFRL